MVIRMKNFVTIYLFELKKILSKKIIWTSVAVMLVLQLAANVSSLFMKNASVDAEGRVTYQTGYEEAMGVREAAQEISGRRINESLLNEMKKAYGDMRIVFYDRESEEGTFTSARAVMVTKEEDRRSAQEIEKDHRTYREIYDYVVNYTGLETAVDINEEKLYQIRRDTLNAENEYWELDEEEIRYWEEQEDKIEKPFLYKYYDGASRFFSRIILLGYLWLFLISIGLANFFGEEHVRRTDQLILCSKNGKAPAYLAKMAAGVTFGMGGTALFYLVQLLTMFTIYGMSGFDLPLQLYVWMCSFPISLGEAIAISFFIAIAAAVLCSVFIMLLSELLRSGVAALAVMFGATLFTIFVPVPVRYGLFSQLYHFMPMQFFNEVMFLDKRLFGIFGKYFTGLQVAPVFYLMMSALLMGAGYQAYKRYQVSGR